MVFILTFVGKRKKAVSPQEMSTMEGVIET